MTGGYDSEIPDSLSKQWTDVPVQEDDYNAGIECVFKDSQKISISESASLDGNIIGGGDLDAFFKMTIDGHIVYDDKQVYRGHMISIYDISAVQYDGQTLLECNPHEVIENLNHEIHTSANPKCYNASERLSPGENFLSDQETLTSKDEHDNPGSYYLPIPAPVLSPMIYARIREDEIQHHYADAVREETELFRLRAKYTPNRPPGPTDYNNRCWDRAHIPNLKGALSDCLTAIGLLNSHRFDPITNKYEAQTEANYEFESAADIYNSTGYVYLKLKLPTKAIHYYSMALGDYPKFAASLYGRGVAEQALDQTTAAAADFSSAKTIDPKITLDFGT